MEYTVKSRTEGLKIGDKVIRTKGSNSGMNIGDSGTVLLKKKIGEQDFVKLKEYSNGWHTLEFLEKIEEEYAETMYDDLVKKAYEKLYNKLKEAEVKNELICKGKELENLKQQKIYIENKIQKLENDIENNIDEELDDKYIEDIIISETSNLVDMSLHRKGKQITCLMRDTDTGKILGKGISKCCPGDEFKIEVGCKIAFNRCFINYHKRQMFKLIHSTC